MLSAWEIRTMLDRKYGAIERENTIRQQEADSSGVLRAAQANQFKVQAGLMPAESASNNALRDAQRLGLIATTAEIAPNAQADRAYTGARTTATLGADRRETAMLPFHQRALAGQTTAAYAGARYSNAGANEQEMLTRGVMGSSFRRPTGPRSFTVTDGVASDEPTRRPLGMGLDAGLYDRGWGMRR